MQSLSLATWLISRCISDVFTAHLHSSSSAWHSNGPSQLKTQYAASLSLQILRSVHIDKKSIENYSSICRLWSFEFQTNRPHRPMHSTCNSQHKITATSFPTIKIAKRRFLLRNRSTIQFSFFFQMHSPFVFFLLLASLAFVSTFIK